MKIVLNVDGKKIGSSLVVKNSSLKILARLETADKTIADLNHKIILEINGEDIPGIRVGSTWIFTMEKRIRWLQNVDLTFKVLPVKPAQLIILPVQSEKVWCERVVTLRSKWLYDWRNVSVFLLVVTGVLFGLIVPIQLISTKLVLLSAIPIATGIGVSVRYIRELIWSYMLKGWVSVPITLFSVFTILQLIHGGVIVYNRTPLELNDESNNLTISPGKSVLINAFGGKSCSGNGILYDQFCSEPGLSCKPRKLENSSSVIKLTSRPWYRIFFNECEIICSDYFAKNKAKNHVPDSLLDEWKDGGSCEVKASKPLSGRTKVSLKPENKSTAVIHWKWWSDSPTNASVDFDKYDIEKWIKLTFINEDTNKTKVGSKIPINAKLGFGLRISGVKDIDQIIVDDPRYNTEIPTPLRSTNTEVHLTVKTYLGSEPSGELIIGIADNKNNNINIIIECWVLKSSLLLSQFELRGNKQSSIFRSLASVLPQSIPVCWHGKDHPEIGEVILAKGWNDIDDWRLEIPAKIFPNTLRGSNFDREPIGELTQVDNQRDYAGILTIRPRRLQKPILHRSLIEMIGFESEEPPNEKYLKQNWEVLKNSSRNYLFWQVWDKDSKGESVFRLKSGSKTFDLTCTDDKNEKLCTMEQDCGQCLIWSSGIKFTEEQKRKYKQKKDEYCKKDESYNRKKILEGTCCDPKISVVCRDNIEEDGS